jgi:hypothetical protein
VATFNIDLSVTANIISHVMSCLMMICA